MAAAARLSIFDFGKASRRKDIHLAGADDPSSSADQRQRTARSVGQEHFAAGWRRVTAESR